MAKKKCITKKKKQASTKRKPKKNVGKEMVGFWTSNPKEK